MKEKSLEMFIREDFQEHLQSLEEGSPLAKVRKMEKEGRHYGTISAERKGLSPEENKNRMEALKDDLHRMGYSGRIKKTRGMWEGGSEASFMVSAHEAGTEHGNKLKSDLIALGKKYDQDSIIHHDGKKAKLYGTNPTGYPGQGNVEGIGTTKMNKSNPYGETEFRSYPKEKENTPKRKGKMSKGSAKIVFDND